MDCLPPSPFLSSDVDMDILTDTAPAPPSYAPVPPHHHTAFVAPQPVSTWRTQSPHATIHTHWDAARNDLPGHSFVAAASQPPVDSSNLNFVPTYHPCPLGPINAMSGQVQDTIEIHWREPPHYAGTSHPTSVATLLDEFERSLTLVTDETPPSEPDNRSNYNFQPESTPTCVIEDEPLELIIGYPPQTNVSDVPLTMLDSTPSNDHLDDSEFGSNFVSNADERTQDDLPPFAKEAVELLGEGNDLNLHDPPPRPFERESTEPLEEGQDQPPGDPPPPSPRFESEATKPLDEDQPPVCFLQLADQPRRSLVSASLSFDTLPEVRPFARHVPRIVHPLAHPRPPTPPPSRCPTKVGPSHGSSTNQRATSAGATFDTQRPSTSIHQERIDPAQVDERASGVGALRPLSVRCGRNARDVKGEEDGEEICPKRRDRTKRTRFVVPDAEDDAEDDPATRHFARPRRTGGAGKATDAATPTLAGSSSIGLRRTTVTGPLRPILRNARATAVPYQKTRLRHAGRRASVA